MSFFINNDSPIIQQSSLSNKSLDFYSTDSEDNFINNKKIKGDDWYYNNTNIKYNFNEWGYRTKNFKDVDEDYILVFGCSCTEGIGLESDKLWSNKLGKELNLDVFNLGKGGSGIDYQFFNTQLFYNFILKNKKRPKLVVYQWPMSHRTMGFFSQPDYKDDAIEIEFFMPMYNNQFNNDAKDKFYEWYLEGFINNKGDYLKQNNLYPLFCNNIWKGLNIPVLNWTYEDDYQFDNLNFLNNEINITIINDNTTNFLGRDLMHNGNFAQEIVVNNLLKQIKENGFSK
jgi:hypothetical protein